MTQSRRSGLHIKLKAPTPREQMVVAGSVKEMGWWDPRNAAALDWTGEAWETKQPIQIPFDQSQKQLEFKFVRAGEASTWEDGIFHRLDVEAPPEGDLEHMLVLRPGNLHYVPKDEDGDGLIDTLIEPEQMRGIAQVKSDRPCEGTDPFLCFMEGTDLLKLQMVPLPSRHVTGSWFGPDFFLRGKEDEDLTDPSEFPFVVRFLGLLNVTEGLPPRIDPNQLDAFGRPLRLPVQIGLDVALNLYRFEDILQEVTPEGGSSYIFFLDGSILAGTGWDHMSVSYGMYESSLQYEKIWQLNTEWSPELTEEDIRSGERLEFYTSNQDLVVVKSLGDTLTQDDDSLGDSAYIGDAIKATSKASLRVLVVVPRDVAVAPLLTLFVDIALGVVVAPFATGGLVCLIFLTLAAVRWCRERCQPVQEEDPYLWKFDDDDD